ncbi:MAG: ferredoxin [Gammaproteobacteria bacterium]|nr:ferredoxin [Gammaproteobacteria bacterium]
MSISAPTDSVLPALPAAQVDADSSKEALHLLRHFHLGDPEVQQRVEPMGKECLPAQLDPFRDSDHLRYEYPLILTSPSTEGEAVTAADLAQPLSSYLQKTVDGFAPDPQSAMILKDNIPWLERELRLSLKGDDDEQGVDGSIAAKPMLEDAGERLIKHLDLKGENSDKFESDLGKLLAAIPDESALLGYGVYSSIQLMIHTIRTVTTPRLEAFDQEIEVLVRGLSRLLDVERENSPEAITPESLERSAGPAAGLLDPSALSKVMVHSQGSVTMTEHRRARIELALETLQDYVCDPVRVRFVHRDNPAFVSWLETFFDIETISDQNPTVRATELFDQLAGELARVFAATRIARLELDDLYDQAIHDPWFETFNWEAFSKDELLQVPTMLVLEAADIIAGEGMPSFSQLLTSGRPIQVLVRVQSYNNPGAGVDDDPFHAYRTELGYLGIAHRQAFVAQTSAARHSHLLTGFIESLDATRTSLHLINTGFTTINNHVPINAWLVTGAALEGRAHPFFRVNPDRGDAAADRMEFGENPSADQNWPVHSFRYQDESGAKVEMDLAFTFADYALLIPRLKPHFAQIPAGCDSPDLVMVADYLTFDEEKAAHLIPYVWGVDKYGTLQRLVISRALALACRDRLNFWHTLQEMAGVRNRYVEQALESAQVEIQAAADQQIAELVENHETALAQARAEAAGEVMGRLTDVLLGMDFSAAAPRVASAAPAAASAPEDAPVVEEEVTEASEPEEEVMSFSDPWIDSPLCSSCNDCLGINPIMFVYNDNNQAVIADTSAGTYAQLVEAAEICPTKCIHPGQPLNPGEPGLDELKLRATPFN